MNQDQLFLLLKKEWNIFSRHVIEQSNRNYNWLFNQPTTYFLPSYFQLGSYYKTNIHYIVISLCKRISKKLWKLFVWPYFIKNAFRLIEKDYFKTLNWNNDLELRNTKVIFFNHLQLLAKKQPTVIADASISDFLNIIGRSLLTYFNYIKGDIDIYRDHKKVQNKQCALLYDQLKPDLFERNDKFILLFFLAARANWIDSFENEAAQFLQGFPTEINEIMASSDLASFVDPLLGIFHTRMIIKFFNTGPKHILYELDNSGEVYFDLLLVEELLKAGHRITLVAKQAPCLNDITLTELQEIMDSPLLAWSIPYRNLNLLDFIHNGSSMPGKSLANVSNNYKQAYEKTDLIILKGQGNFQTMPIGYRNNKKFNPYFYKKPILIMMGVKSNLIHYSLKQIFKENLPRLQSLFIYFFDPTNFNTYPR